MIKPILILFLTACVLNAREYPIEKVTKVIDGDTIDVVIDLGFGGGKSS